MEAHVVVFRTEGGKRKSFEDYREGNWRGSGKFHKLSRNGIGIGSGQDGHEGLWNLKRFEFPDFAQLQSEVL